MLPKRSTKNVLHESKILSRDETSFAEHSYSQNPIIRRFLHHLFTSIKIPSTLPALSKKELYLPPTKRRGHHKAKNIALRDSSRSRKNLKRVTDILREFKSCSDLLDESKEWKFEDTSQQSQKSDILTPPDSVASYLSKSRSSTADSGIGSISSDLVSDEDSLSTSSFCTNSLENSSASSSNANFNMPSLMQLFSTPSYTEDSTEEASASSSTQPVTSEADKSPSLLAIFNATCMKYNNLKNRRINPKRKPYKAQLDSVSISVLKKNQSHLLDVLTKRKQVTSSKTCKIWLSLSLSLCVCFLYELSTPCFVLSRSVLFLH